MIDFSQISKLLQRKLGKSGAYLYSLFYFAIYINMCFSLDVFFDYGSAYSFLWLYCLLYWVPWNPIKPWRFCAIITLCIIEVFLNLVSFIFSFIAFNNIYPIIFGCVFVVYLFVKCYDVTMFSLEYSKKLDI